MTHAVTESSQEALSQRGARAAASVLRADMDIYAQALDNLYDETSNPNGVMFMNVAENHLGWNIIKQKVQDISRTQSLPDWIGSYTELQGNPDVRRAVASFMERHLTQCSVDPDKIALTAGAGAAIDLIAHIVGDEGDVVAIPAPSYPVYTHDLGARSMLDRYDVVTHHEPDEIAAGPALTVADLDEALGTIVANQARLRLVVITTPDNPTGGIYAHDQLLAISEWCIDHGIHLLVNEIYALSTIDPQHPQLAGHYPARVQFSSFAKIINDKRSDYLHYCYAFSKDFGVSGFRLGVVYSLNEAFMSAFANLNVAHMTSNHTQWILQQLLEDTEFVGSYLTDNRAQLTEAYVTVVEQLEASAIPYVPSRGSLFVWVDLSEFLPASTEEAAHDLWLEIYERAGLLLTPGAGFGHSKHGMFRIVYPCLQPDELRVAMERLGAYVRRKRS